jgi:hypothetical protein
VDRRQRGESLIDTVVSCALIAAISAAVGASLIAATHRFGPDPVQQLLEQTAANEMRVAVDIAKYRGSLLLPASIATSVPLPSSSPLPILLSLAPATISGGGVSITIVATSASDRSKSATLTQTVLAPAPLPGSSVTSNVSGAAPQ